MVEGELVVLVAERDIERRAGRRDLHVRNDHGLAAADARPHGLAEHGVYTGAALFLLAREAHDRALAVGNGGTLELCDHLADEPFAHDLADLEHRAQVGDEAAGKGVLHDGEAGNAHDRGGQGLPEFDLDGLAYEQRLADLDHSLAPACGGSLQA